jgi:enoyl-CoA hydratase
VDVAGHGKHVAVVTLRRPQARNAVNALVAKELEALVAQVEDDPDIRVAIITGEGAAFCAGADLKEVSEGGLNHLFTSRGGFAGFVNADRRKPWIAAVNGAALAGGCEIALACDIIVAAADARFGLPEVTRGLIASAGGLYRLPRILPRSLAAEMILSGEPISAQRALQAGLVSRIAPDTALDEALALAERIAGAAPLAVRESLAILKRAAFVDDEQLRRAGDSAQARLESTSDFTEGARAFVEKRAPRWQGR